mmetsp:Transcript_12560/g.17821  ORF Transcript_12560/g.17821 Transcript_12560/m.17821 type:complete len:387 (-) Transcript_12560:64-1224(-)
MVHFRSICVAALATTVVASNPLGSLVNQARKTLNFSSFIGSARRTAETPYDLVAGHPVFQVTTPWGAPYMNFERIMDNDDTSTDTMSTKTDGFDDTGAMRPVALFFMDPADAVELQAQMKQMSNMADSDMRITATTLAKALRQSANLGNGLVTGTPIEPKDGKLKSMNDGGSLRYKIVPPKRQLYYAARCKGKERVGHFGANPWEDARAAVIGNNAIAGFNMDRRNERSERKVKAMTPEQRASAHMDGYTGIPVFYAPEMKRVIPKLKQLTSGNKEELPFFFSYEDLMDSWDKLREKSKGKIPAKPNVEVFNMWDVLTSMEKDDWKKKRNTASLLKDPLGPLRERFASKTEPGLDSITFIPPSSGAHYKEQISAQGNGKARLRPMR